MVLGKTKEKLTGAKKVELGSLKKRHGHFELGFFGIHYVNAYEFPKPKRKMAEKKKNC